MMHNFSRFISCVTNRSLAFGFLSALGFFLASIAPLPAQVAPETRMFDVVKLRSGGEFEGVVSEQESDGKKYYMIDLEDGTKIKLDTKAVARVIRPPEAYQAYLKLAENLGDTVESHWEMQAWCRDNRLSKQRTYHLNRIIELDPEFVEARSLLNYKKRHGVWLLDDHYFSSQGFVKFKNNWRLPQGVNYVEQREERRETVGDWKKKLYNMRSKFYKNDLFEDDFLDVKDPAAVATIIELYDDRKTNARFSRVVIEMLGGIPSNATHRKLISVYLFDPDTINFERALTLLKQDHFDPIVTSRAMYPFMRPEEGTPNELVRRAGFLIGEFNDKAAIRHLINGITTTHVENNPRAQSGNMNVGKGSGVNGTQFNQGDGEPKKLMKIYKNGSVLHALERISGRSFGYSKQKWLAWYIETQTLSNVDLRRDE